MITADDRRLRCFLRTGDTVLICSVRETSADRDCWALERWWGASWTRSTRREKTSSRRWASACRGGEEYGIYTPPPVESAPTLDNTTVVIIWYCTVFVFYKMHFLFIETKICDLLYYVVDNIVWYKLILLSKWFHHWLWYGILKSMILCCFIFTNREYATSYNLMSG